MAGSDFWSCLYIHYSCFWSILSQPLLYTAPCPLIVTLQRYIEYLAPNVKGTLLHKRCHAKPQPLRTGVVAFGPLLSKYLHNSQRAPTQCSGQFSYSAIIPSSFLPHCVIYLGVSAGSENYQQFSNEG